MLVRLSTSSLALAVAMAAPGLALTPEELWSSWTTSYEAMGYTVTEGSRELAGDTLTLGDVSFRVEEAGTAEGLTVSLSQIVMQGAADGSVRTTFPETMPLKIDTVDEEGRPVVIEMTLAAPNLDLQSTGDAAQHTDTYSGPSITVTVDRVDLAEEPDLADVATITVNEVSGQSVTSDGGRSISQTNRSGRIDYRIGVETADGSLAANGSIEGSESSGEVAGAPEGSPGLQEALDEALKAGAVIAGRFSLGAGTHQVEFAGTDSEGEPSSGNLALKIGPAEMTIRLAEEGIAYQGAATGIDTRIEGGDMPFPVAYQLGEVTFDVQFPVTASEAPQPFKIAYSLAGLAVDEAIWATFDPGEQLPRDPASLDIDVTGQVRVTQDLFDPALAQAAGDAAGEAAGGMDETDATGTEPSEGTADAADDTADMPSPVEPVELTINQLALAALGARIAAEGQLAVPESGDLSQPVGTISAQMDGANGLIERLTAMGLLPPEQVQVVRMMLAMFTRPGVGPDNLVSEFEFREGGQIFANGQQIR
ncbi:DUF2125 domain-containing protein [Paracoccus sp. S-4012]|uniref:DUF2125 domain-containing protein n=1 Tax=Paracoccus sp. S-4012 TaxID=2665648 RepID=UPI0012AEE14E|nr:DUF2125 domain-containing protein [Paracoccus sp. S-4012]MRX49814.1 DUF2125 domain-containing protein [Paracoccus sp. S-4012]